MTMMMKQMYIAFVWIFVSLFSSVSPVFTYDPTTENDVKLDFDYATNDILSVKLHFKKFFPVPSCTVSIEDIQLTFADRTFQSKGLYLEGHLLYQSSYKLKEHTLYTVICKCNRETRVIKTVKRETETQPIRFGGTVAYVCPVNEQESNNTEETRKWFKRSDLVSYNGQTINHLKYKESKKRKQYKVYIYNVTEDDLMSRYTCLYWSKTYTAFKDLTGENFEAVKWETRTNMIKFGRTVALFCIVHEQEFINPEETRRWHKGSDLVSYNGQTTNHLKYKESKEINKSKLYIYNATEDDLMSRYICLYSYEYTDFTDLTDENVESVKWETETKIIRFGGTVALVCTVHGQELINPEETRKWFKRSNLASYNGQTTNPLKYKESKERNKFKLYIYNVTEDDLMSRYTCLYSFETHTAFIELTEQNFEYPPTENNINLDYDYTTNDILSVKLHFEKVFPVPNCTVSVEGSQLTFAEISHESKGLYLEVYLHHKSNHKFKEDTPFTVTCKLQLGYTYVRETRVIKRVIPVINSVIPSENPFPKILLVFGMLMALVITVIIGVRLVDYYDSKKKVP